MDVVSAGAEDGEDRVTDGTFLGASEQAATRGRVQLSTAGGKRTLGATP